MAKMTSDLYYTQLCEIPSFDVQDKRTTPSIPEVPDISDFSDTNLSFYTEISKNEDDTWLVTIHVYKKSTMTEYSKSKKFDSFYKILVESKQNLQESIKTLIANYSSSETEQISQIELKQNTNTQVISSESLSGNWTGEEFIDKIVIMKGGRGFIIFKNGASMNISVLLDGSTVTIKQNGKTNASFFPELPRAQALSAALSAEPITWTLTSVDSNTLKGQKRTLLPENDSYEYGTLDVIWSKTN